MLAGDTESLASGRLDGKVAIITGCSGGIGSVTAALFAREGADLLCVDINEEALSPVATQIANEFPKRKVVSMKADVGDEKEVENVIALCMKRLGRLDIFVANAAIHIHKNNLQDISVQQFTDVWRVNTLGVFLAIQKASRVMLEQSIKGSIICVASVAGLRAGAAGPDYSASKAGVISLAQTCSWYLHGTGIRVNAICPLFEHARNIGKEKELASLNPLSRPGAAGEIAKVALFLAGDDSSFVNGQAVVACGGWSSSLPFNPALVSSLS